MKLTRTVYKLFYEEDGLYGEFFIEINPDDKTAQISSKDPDYAEVLLSGLSEALT
jgi:hypothetical protein